MGAERIHRPIRQSSGPDRQWSGTQKQPRLRYNVGAVKPPAQQPQARGEFASRNLLSNPEMAAQVFGTGNGTPDSNGPEEDEMSTNRSPATKALGQVTDNAHNTQKKEPEHQPALTKGVELGFEPGDEPPNNCSDLIRQIMRLVESLGQRMTEMLRDEWGLYDGNVGPDGSTWEGHQKRYETEVESLSERYRKFDDDCDDYDMQYNEEIAYSEATLLINSEPPDRPADTTSRQNAINEILRLGGEIVGGVVIIAKGIGWVIGKTIEVLAFFLGLDVQRQH